MKKKPLVLVLAGSASDAPALKGAREALEELSIPFSFRVASAHRTPDRAASLVEKAEKDGVRVIIACAGMANHLAGAAAARTVLPVIGVPLASSALGGLDSLLSTVQMPAGIPVGTLAIGKPGATNAALLAVAILAGRRTDLRHKLQAFREEQTARVLKEKVP